MTCGWFLGPALCVGLVGGSRNQHYDLLVALEMAVLETRGPWLHVGGFWGQRRVGEGVETHQRVIMTRWWFLKIG